MYTSERTDRVTWQLKNTTGIPMLGRVQVKLMNYISYPEIHAPENKEYQQVSADSLKSTDYIHSLETMGDSVKATPATD